MQEEKKIHFELTDINDDIVDLRDFYLSVDEHNIPQENGEIPIFESVKNRDLQSLSLFAINCPDLNIRNRLFLTPLMLSISFNFLDGVIILILNDADVNCVDKGNRTALTYALLKANLDVINLLLESGVDMKIVDRNGLNALMYASISNLSGESRLKELTVNGEVLREPNDDEIIYYYKFVVEYLLEKDVQISEKDKQGLDALFHAVNKSNSEMVEVLIDFGADVNTTYPDGSTPLMISIRMNHEDIIEVIMAPKDIIVDFFFVDDFVFPSLLALHLLRQILKATNHRIRIINTKKSLKAKLKLSIFSDEDLFFENLDLALLDFTSGDSKPETYNFIKALVTATMKSMFIQAKIPCNRKKVYFKDTDKDKFCSEVVSITTVQPGKHSYFFSISFPEKSFIKIMSNMLMEEVTEIDDENKDGAAELANIIMGQTKNIFNLLSKEEFKTGFPQVHLGRECPKIYLNDKRFDWDNATIAVIPFYSSWGPFHLELFFSKNLSQEEINQIIFN